jgi:hypothetical protein
MYHILFGLLIILQFTWQKMLSPPKSNSKINQIFILKLEQTLHMLMVHLGSKHITRNQKGEMLNIIKQNQTLFFTI